MNINRMAVSKDKPMLAVSQPASTAAKAPIAAEKAPIRLSFPPSLAAASGVALE
ncbi:hypothetical protein [Cupriavidus lacunae]|uniref:hypothetical protein n=1 Tax=Cupriavidus lacunae TaxID=2666307 RepID=UPI0013753282|nr:hypothetical protein [Cupriavidus lacunae]